MKKCVLPVVLFSAAVIAAPVHSARTEARIRDAAMKTVSLIEKTGETWKIPCISCHHQGLGMMTLEAARNHGLPVNETALQAHAAKTLRQLSGYEFAVHMPIDTFAFGYGLMASHAAGIAPNITTAIITRHISGFQKADGSWPSADARPPHSYSRFAATAIATRVLSLYLPSQFAAQREQNFANARQWFNTEQPASCEDRSFRLMGLNWAGAPIEERRTAIADLLAKQLSDGGWAQVPGMVADAYSTGEALVALRQAGGMKTQDPAFRRGIEYLLKNQTAEGAWIVKSRLHSPALISPPFFDSGFPGGKDQFISFAASAWAAMALMEALPETARPARPRGVKEGEPKNVPSWVETAVFGGASDVKKLLDGGLDPNSATEGGTTLLMYAAPDIPKMKVLLERGANVNTQTRNGNTALSVAACYQGAASAVRFLIERGAAVEPTDVKLEATPLWAASAAGDPEVLAALINAGLQVTRHVEAANPFTPTPIFSAVQSDHVEFVRMLVKSGANVNEKDGQEMTPLIWAALAHRTDMVKALLDLGADAAIVDKYGYTAMKHTEDIAFGDPKTVEALNTSKRRTQRASAR